MPASRNLGPSVHQIGPSPSQTWVGVHSKVWPFGMIGTSAFASAGQIARATNPTMSNCNLRYGMAEALFCNLCEKRSMCCEFYSNRSAKVEPKGNFVRNSVNLGGRRFCIYSESLEWLATLRPVFSSVNGRAGPGASGRAIKVRNFVNSVPCA